MAKGDIHSQREFAVNVDILPPHPHQVEFINSKAKRKIVRAGRRSGKTVGAAIMAVQDFLANRRVLYAAPTSEQTQKFWFEVCTALREPIDAKVLIKNETEKFIERPRSENRIKAKTAWNADTLRGDYADKLILDEWQLMNEDTWEIVGAPMLLDNAGDAVFIYTPPSLVSQGASKARDPRHAALMFKTAKADTTGRWATFHFTSYDNPHISKDALAEISKDMSMAAYRQEILAEDEDIPTSWLVYSAFNAAKCKIPRFEIPKDWPVYSGHDFGGANPAALFFARIKIPLPVGASLQLRLNDLVCFHSYLPGGGKSTAQHVEAFNQITKGYKVEQSRGGSHQEDEIRQGYTAQGWPISEPIIDGRPGSNTVDAQIDRVRALMENDKVYFFDDLYHPLTELVLCRWKLDTDGKPTDEIEDKHKWHLCDAMRYILSYFRSETVGKYKLKSFPMY